jgi:DNA-binding transcriptional LysR family regulator
MPELEHWRAFVRVADCGSFSRAADQLHVARSAVSRRVRELETQIGVTLLRRSTRSVRLTDEGLVLYERASQLLADFEDLRRGVARGAAAANGRIRFSAPMSFALRHLLEPLEAFRRAYPGITLDLQLGDRRVDLVSEGFDLALRIGMEVEGSLVAKRLCAIEHVVVASPEYLARAGVPQRPEDLERHTVFSYGYRTNPHRWAYLAADGARGEAVVHPSLVANNGDALIAAACAGGGIACQPTFIACDAIERGELRPLLTDWNWGRMHAYLVFPPDRRMPQRVRLLMTALQAALTDPPAWDERVRRSLARAPSPRTRRRPAARGSAA